MKKIIALFAAVLLVGTMCFAADPAEGFWISVDEKTNEDQDVLDGGKSSIQIKLKDGQIKEIIFIIIFKFSNTFFSK